MKILAETILQNIIDIHPALDLELMNIYNKAKHLQASYINIKNEMNEEFNRELNTLDDKEKKDVKKL